MLKNVLAALRVLTVCIGFVVWAGASHAAAIVGIQVNANGLTFGPGDTLRVTVSAQNIGGPPLTGDFYFGVIHPDGVNATFIGPGFAVQRRLDADPRTFPPFQANVVIPTGFDHSFQDFFVYTLSSEPVGNYRFFAVLTTPRPFATGVLLPSDILLSGQAAIAVSSSSRGPRR